MTAQTLVTNNFKTHNVNQFIESVDESANTIYYVTAGNHLPYANGDSIIPSQNNNVFNLSTTIYQNMIFGKKINSEDVVVMAKRVEWESGTVYDMYDDKDSTLSLKQYYVMVDEGAYIHVYKCLYNAAGGESTIQPNFGDVTQETSLYDVDDGFYQMSDGYQWKYMYSVSTAVFTKFSTLDYMPIVANASVVSSAINGSIDVVHVEDGGTRYDNYYSGIFNGEDIQINSNASLDSSLNYAIGSNAQSANGFYNGCIIHVVEGSGKGQYRLITNYVNDGAKKIVVVNNAFTNVSSTSEYAISPMVTITGDCTSPAAARAVINATGNTVQSIEILSRGEGYHFASANVLYSNVVPVVTTTSVRPIISPYGGHGFNAQEELNGVNLGISISFANSESNTISTDNDFRTISIIKDPLFANVVMTHVKVSDGTSGADGTFLAGERIDQIRTVKIAGSISVNTTSSVITGTGTDFDESFNPNDMVLIESGNSHLVTSIASITNSSSLSIAANGTFTNSDAIIYTTKSIASGYAIGAVPGSVILTSVSGFFIPSRKIVGFSSGAVANVVDISINNINRNAGYQTINQMNRLVGDVTSGEFDEDEVVYQGSINIANATFHSIESDGNGHYNMFFTNQMGTFDPSLPIVGNSTGSVFTPTSYHLGDLIAGSGDVIYAQNDNVVARSNNQTEVIKIIIGF
jgi:hypothetical protein